MFLDKKFRKWPKKKKKKGENVEILIPVFLNFLGNLTLELFICLFVLALINEEYYLSHVALW